GRLLRQHFEQHDQAFLADTDTLLDQINGKISAYGPSFLDAKLAFSMTTHLTIYGSTTKSASHWTFGFVEVVVVIIWVA
ncbi:MAG: hypothetical protein ACK56F_32835, partial [bacterium]